MHVLIAGCGWLGQALGSAFLRRGDRVTGVVRRGTNRAELEQLGLDVLLLDLSDPRSAQAVPADLDAVIACQAPGDPSLGSYRQTYVDVTGNLLAASRSRPIRSFVYTSSTRVFGQSDGSQVDETTPPAPEGDHARILLEAERLVRLAAERDGMRTSVVRISGLYGPGRLPLVERLRRGEIGLGVDDEVWMNFCHRDDAVATILAAVDRGARGAVYHATDAEPARKKEVLLWIASRLGIEPPREEAPPLRSKGPRPNRRISGEWTRRELGVGLLFPSFREGFAPLLEP
jgi:nucleoside-diphosphate-sugar epimerase